jgi:hypothetical protein
LAKDPFYPIHSSKIIPMSVYPNAFVTFKELNVMQIACETSASGKFVSSQEYSVSSLLLTRPTSCQTNKMTAKNNDTIALIGRLSAILMSVRLAIGADHGWRRLPPALLTAIFVRINHYAVRFRIIAVESRFLAAPRRPASRSAAKIATSPPIMPPPLRKPARPLIPSRRGWLRHLLPTHYLAPPRAAMIELLASSEMSALINANPRIGRVLRPLCHMLAVPLPAELRLPSRPPITKPSPATKRRGRRKHPPAPPSFAPSPIPTWPRPRLPGHLYRDDPDYFSNF